MIGFSNGGLLCRFKGLTCSARLDRRRVTLLLLAISIARKDTESCCTRSCHSKLVSPFGTAKLAMPRQFAFAALIGEGSLRYHLSVVFGRSAEEITEIALVYLCS